MRTKCTNMCVCDCVFVASRIPFATIPFSQFFSSVVVIPSFLRAFVCIRKSSTKCENNKRSDILCLYICTLYVPKSWYNPSPCSLSLSGSECTYAGILILQIARAGFRRKKKPKKLSEATTTTTLNRFILAIYDQTSISRILLHLSVISCRISTVDAMRRAKIHSSLTAALKESSRTFCENEKWIHK